MPIQRRGPDGWRFARVRWPKSIKPSRRLHYFKNGWSLCGNHHDGVEGWYTKTTELPENECTPPYPCKICQKKLRGKRIDVT